MINGILLWVAKFAFGSKILEYVHQANNLLVGRRSEILLSIVAVIEILRHTGILTDDVASPITTALLGALPITLAEKAGKIIKQADQVLPKAPNEPAKPS